MNHAGVLIDLATPESSQMTTNHQRRRRWIFSVAVLGLVVCEAGARAAAQGPAVQVKAVLDCRAIPENSARLACYDAAVAAMGQAEVKGDLLTLDKEQRRTVRRQSFGLTLPSFTLFDRGEKPEEADRLISKIASVSRLPRGQWVIHLEDGAVWRQIDEEELRRDPKAGQAVAIRRAALGSFLMNIDGQSAIRVHRDS